MAGKNLCVAVVSRFRRRPRPFGERQTRLEKHSEVQWPEPALISGQNMKDKAIYILGAGCSANYGYPYHQRLPRRFEEV